MELNIIAWRYWYHKNIIQSTNPNRLITPWITHKHALQGQIGVFPLWITSSGKSISLWFMQNASPFKEGQCPTPAHLMFIDPLSSRPIWQRSDSVWIWRRCTDTGWIFSSLWEFASRAPGRHFLVLVAVNSDHTWRWRTRIITQRWWRQAPKRKEVMSEITGLAQTGSRTRRHTKRGWIRLQVAAAAVVPALMLRRGSEC